MGSLEGVFVADKSHIEKLTESGIEVYFGEVLGKHSEVYGPIEPSDITMVSDCDNVVSAVLDHNLSSGYNPLNYTYIGVEDRIDDETVGEYIERNLLNN
jgi:hypothetical protein